MTLETANIQLRITALWAFSEAFLGGILHAFHIPFTGLILSSVAVVCMAAMATKGDSKGQILKATLLVLITKALLSPHTPVSAYFAVLLQGALGELFFLVGLPFFLSCLFLGISSLLQSAFQKLIILTLIFGVGFWEAMDEFLNSITKIMGASNVAYSFYLIAIYLCIHLLVGVFIGVFASRLPFYFSVGEIAFKAKVFLIPKDLGYIPFVGKAKNKFSKPIYWILFFLLCIALYQAYSTGSLSPIVQSKALKLIIRSSLFILTWYFFIAPLLLMAFQKWLAKQQSKFSKEVDRILKLIPEMKYITEQCWLRTNDLRGLHRISQFIQFTFFMLLATPNAVIHP